jgi:hypothetical protein
VDVFPTDSITLITPRYRSIIFSDSFNFNFFKDTNITPQTTTAVATGQRIIHCGSEEITLSPHHVCHLLKRSKSQKVNGRINLED